VLDNVITKPIHRILTDLTQEPRLEVALPLAMKDWVRLKLKETRELQTEFEQRYGMAFDAFKQAWLADHIANAHSYAVERDYWEWEAAVSDAERLLEIAESLA
jgi:asparagine synthetase A